MRKSIPALPLALLFVLLSVQSGFGQTWTETVASGSPTVEVASGSLIIPIGPPMPVSISVPPGWVASVEKARPMKLLAVFYPDNSPWENAKTYMYLATIPKKNLGLPLDSIIMGERKRFQDQSQTLSISEEPALIIHGTESARVFRFIDVTQGKCEMVAYLDQINAVQLFVLVGENEERLQATLGAFRSLVSSYRVLDALH